MRYFRVVVAVVILIVVGLSIFAGIRIFRNLHDELISKGVRIGYSLTINGILNQIKTNGFVTIKTDSGSITLIRKPDGGDGK